MINKIIVWIKSHIPELITFGAIGGITLLLTGFDYTWINTDCDGIHYVYSAEYLYPAHKTSAPLYLLLGHLFLYIPIGTEYFRMALISVCATTIASVFIYMAIKFRTDNRWYGLIGAILYGSSALIISQSTIVESYALLTMFGVLGYYFSKKKRWLATVLSLGCGLAIHPLALFYIIPIFISNRKELFTKKWVIITLAFLLFYLYIPITNRPPYLWQSSSSILSSEGIGDFINDVGSTIMMLTGGISMWDIPKRILDTILLFGVSLGVGMIPLLWKRTKILKEPLFWMMLLPTIYFVVDLSIQTYVYLMPAIAFACIYIGDVLHKFNKKILYAGMACVLALWAFNINYFDIGRTLDSNMEASNYYYNELDKVPDGDILLCQQGWEWAAVASYNKNYNRDIKYLYTDVLISPEYQKTLVEYGLEYIDDNTLTMKERTKLIGQSILTLNQDKNIYVTIPTDMSNYGCEVVKANGDITLLEWESREIFDEDGNVIVYLMPSNPYDIITGTIEVKEWRDVLYSNMSVLSLFMMGTIGFVPCWILYQVIIKKKKFKIGKK
jgi:hypothetical protein